MPFQIWDIEADKELYRFTIPVLSLNPYPAQISPDGKSFVTIEADAALFQWELPTGKKLHQFC
jgi:hypothetical protein